MTLYISGLAGFRCVKRRWWGCLFYEAGKAEQCWGVNEISAPLKGRRESGIRARRGPDTSQLSLYQAHGAQSMFTGLRQIEAIGIHDLGPGRNEILDEPVFGIILGVYLG